MINNMTDNLIVTKIDGHWTVMTSITKRTYFTGTKEECEDYLENY